MNFNFTTRLLQFSFALSFFLFCTYANAQLVIDGTITPEELVNDYLLGEGVVATEITFNGQPANAVNPQIGYFNSENSNVPFAEGIIMANGLIETAVGPNSAGGSTGSLPFGTQGPVDPDLAAIIDPISANDNAVLEFNFIPNGDTVSFNFVFASEEYNEYVCGNVNDVFGFFISGPGITGPYTLGAENIALIPDTDIPVSINTLNNGTVGSNGSIVNCNNLDPNWTENSVFFVDNPQGAGSTNIEYDGLTVSIRAFIPVQCGEEYHIKLAIADGGDTSFDSGVFLEGGSFSSNGTVEVDLSPNIAGASINNPEYADVLVEGCSTSEVYIVRADTEGELLGSVTLGGNATYGIDGDYYLVGDTALTDTSLTFAPGQDTLTLTIQTVGDDLENEGDSIIVYVTTYNTCGMEETFSASVHIVDPYDIDSQTEDLFVVCPADSVFVTVEGLEGIEPYYATWSSNTDLSDTVPNGYFPLPDDSVMVWVNLTDACGLSYVKDSLTIYNVIPPALDVNIAQSEEPLCPGDDVVLTAQPTNGLPDYIYVWSNNDGASSTTVNFLETDSVFLVVYDQCGTPVKDSIEVFVPSYEKVTATLDSLEIACPLDTAILAPNVGGGAGNYTYAWDYPGSNGETTPTLIANPFSTTNYTFTATDQCDSSATVTNKVIINHVPLTAGRVLGTANCDGTELILAVDSLQGGLAPYSFNWRAVDGTGETIEFTSNDPTTGRAVVSNPENVSYSIDVVDNCPGAGYPALAIDYVPKIVKLSNLMNVITPNNDGKNDRFEIAGIENFPTSQFEVFDRWGKSVFATNAEINSWDAADLTDGTYFYVLTIDNGECERTGYFQVLGSND